MKKAVFFFCTDSSIDPVASHVFRELSMLIPLTATDLEFDGNAVMLWSDVSGNEYHFARLNDVLSHDYIRYMPLLKPHYSDFDFAAVVNWHQGASAPDRIFCAHTTGDMNSGVYGAANPLFFRNLLHGLEKHRLLNGLGDYKVISEATHWSGVLYNQPTSMITDFPVPLVDVEIGSYPESWGDPMAAKVLAASLLEVFSSSVGIQSFLCIGGMHFASSFSDLAMTTAFTAGLSHVLASQWLASGCYDTEAGFERLKAAAEATVGELNGIIFHDSLKGIYKQQCKRLAEWCGLPLINSKQIKNPALFIQQTS